MKPAAEPARTLTASRRAGYRLLPGDAFSYLLHLRPREWPIMAAHTALGTLLAAGIVPVFHGEALGPLVLALVMWVVCLNGGTLALNSAFDRDTGDIGYLDAPPPAPPYLAHWGIGLMAAGQGLALLLLPAGFAAAYAICFALSLLYSVPPARLKAVAGVDWAINMIGFGALTPYAGWAATGRPLTVTAAWIFAAFGVLFGALYPLTQLYQLREDAERGDRTFALVLGLRGSLLLAIVLVAIAFACFARSAVVVGARPRGWAVLAAAALAWMAVVLPWFARSARMRPAEHKRGMYAALAAWAITDLAVLLVFAGH